MTNDKLFSKLAQDERKRFHASGDSTVIFREIQDIQIISERGCEYADGAGDKTTYGDLWRAPSTEGWQNKPHRYLYDALRECGLLHRALAAKDAEIANLKADKAALLGPR